MPEKINSAGPRKRRPPKRADGHDRKQPNSDALLKKILRERAGLTQEQLAQRMRVLTGKRRNDAWVSRQESPKHEPEYRDLKDYDAVFGLPDAMFRFISLTTANYRERVKRTKAEELAALLMATMRMRERLYKKITERQLHDLALPGTAEEQQEALIMEFLDMCDAAGLRTRPKR